MARGRCTRTPRSSPLAWAMASCRPCLMLSNAVLMMFFLSRFRPTHQPSRLVSRHRSDVVGCAPPSERSARRIAQAIPSGLASDATPRCASLARAGPQVGGGGRGFVGGCFAGGGGGVFPRERVVGAGADLRAHAACQGVGGAACGEG